MIDIESAAELLSAMIAIPSINPDLKRDGVPAEWFGEAAMAHFVAGWLVEVGVAARLDEVEPGRPNVVAELAGAPGSPTLLFEGHLDTVQVDGMDAPFLPRREGNRLYGRGAVDDKGCLAMFMLALRELKQRGSAVGVTFVAAIDEEVTFKGVAHHLRHHGRHDGGVAGEPTGLDIYRACKGAVRWHIDVIGKAAHASRPEEGLDAIQGASELLALLKGYMARTNSAHQHDLLGGRTLTCTMIAGGEGPNSLASKVRLTFDCRPLPDQTGPEIWAEIAAAVAGFEASSAYRYVMHPTFIDSISMEVPAEAGIVAELLAATQRHAGSGRILGASFGSDASKMTRAGTPSVIFGPGDIAMAHSVDEHVDLEEVVRAAEILVDLAETFAVRPSR
ncbi:hypothetical protein C3941_02415 [Kaistia algarum]|uniref:M20 family metallopeptidase n=1 Tax=Kaistia algarum TaxID=2083279 RepID=UPI000CE91E90|nr:M20/M25/M40 family metallo-hydrolase [Kaistia algarum]MCX5512932.1 M20/M25/M40 family metallo-hydrolase [Kaistia algarum]PPE81580.1 hypothetical protein C3941_02415 [Kaistia algarum]